MALAIRLLSTINIITLVQIPTRSWLPNQAITPTIKIDQPELHRRKDHNRDLGREIDADPAQDPAHVTDAAEDDAELDLDPDLDHVIATANEENFNGRSIKSQACKN